MGEAGDRLNRVMEIAPVVIANCFIEIISDLLMSDLMDPHGNV